MRVSTLIIVVALVGGGAYLGWKQGWFAEMQERADKSFSMHLNEGQRLYQAVKYEEAIASLQKAYDLEPRNPDSAVCLMRMGDCYKELKQPAKAVECYKRCLAEFPEFKMRGQVEQSIQKVQDLGHF